MKTCELSKAWFDFAIENPEKIRPIHSAIYFYAIEQKSRLGGKESFGFHSQIVMEGIGVKNWRPYALALKDLVEWGFIEMVSVSKNQHTANIISIVPPQK